MKKALVTKVTKFEKKDNYGNTSFSIEFSNGDKGFYSTKTEEQSKFVAGQDSEYEIEEKIGKTGNPWYKITLPGSEQQGFKPGGGRPQVEPRVQMISFAMAYAKDLVVAGKVDMKALPETFDIIYNEMIGKL